MKYKTVWIFDWDGTVFDSFPHSQKIIQILAKRFKVSLPDVNSQEFKKILGRGIYQMIKLCFPDCNFEEVHREWKKLENSMNIGLVPGTEEAIEELKKRGFIVGLLTNRTWESLKRYKKLWKPLKFDFIQTSEYEQQPRRRFKNHLVTTNFKPDFRCFKPVFEWLIWKKQVESKKIFVIGDSLPDFEAATNADRFYGCEIKPITVLTGPIKTRKEWYEITGVSEDKRFFILRSVADLPKWLEDREKEERFNFKIKLF